MSKKPNILFIFSDQHRGDTMGCVGHPTVITPNLDKLAAQGIVFRQCSTNSPLCIPARCTMMSGQYVSQHGAWDNAAPSDRHGPSHVRNIRDKGYHTALIGKTHLWEGEAKQGQSTRDIAYQLRDWGFEDTMELVSTVYPGGLSNAWSEYLESKGLLEGYIQSIRNFNRLNRSFQRKPWEDPSAPLPSPEDHIDAFCGRKTVEWIKNYNTDKPFYLQVLFPGPHPPFNSAPEYRALYQPGKMPVGILQSPRPPLPSYVDYVMRWSAMQEMTPAQMQTLRAYYYAKITLIDEYIGKIYAALKERGLLDNTWIICSSDHGENAGDHRLTQKLVFYESALNVPCIIVPPGGTAPRQSQVLTDHIDLMATITEIAGAELPAGCDGVSLLPEVISGTVKRKGKEAVFSEVLGHTMVKTDRWKMAVNASTREPVELFDELNDRDELNNIVLEPAYKKIREELLEQYLNPLLENMNRVKYEQWASRRARA